jgi:hypothetical protein
MKTFIENSVRSRKESFQQVLFKTGKGGEFHHQYFCHLPSREDRGLFRIIISQELRTFAVLLPKEDIFHEGENLTNSILLVKAIARVGKIHTAERGARSGSFPGNALFLYEP